MKNIFLGLLLLLSSQTFSQNNFRGITWGTSFTELKSKYPEVQWEIQTDENMKSYKAEDYVGGLKVNVYYLFIEDKLTIGAYEFKEDHSSNNLYYEDFLSISNILNQKYKMEKEEKWNNTTWKNRPDNIGHALYMGDVEIVENYEDEETSIVHRISSDDSIGIEHVLVYRDMDYVKSQRASILDDF